MKLITVFFILLITNIAFADTWVNSYTKRDGTYVQGHYRTRANNNVYDNYSTKGNTNPYTGSRGTKSYDSNNYNYGSKRNNYGW